MYENKLDKSISPIQKKSTHKNVLNSQPKEKTINPMQFFKSDRPNILTSPTQCINQENDTKSKVTQCKANNTGLPDNLKSGVENLSGYSLDDVNVHYNSPKPIQMQALAYTQGSDIHVAPGQEKYLPHEAWHVVQQKQSRVAPTRQLKSLNINDDTFLEKEADIMGAKALTVQMKINTVKQNNNSNQSITQMARDDTFKINAGQCGTDPTVPVGGAGIGLTCHHIIDAALLDAFYEVCVHYGLENKWIGGATASATATAQVRPPAAGQNITRSSCDWMCGNIFIGPDATNRIDDSHGGFDFGGYLSDKFRPSNPSQATKQTVNSQMADLEFIYPKVTSIVSRTHVKRGGQYIILPPGQLPEISKIKSSITEAVALITKISKKQNTVQKTDFNQQTPAYNIDSWISVGVPNIPNMQIENINFSNMYNYYNKLLRLPLPRIQSQTKYVELFEKYINIGQCANLTIQQFTMARNTYNILYDAWQKCIV